MPAVLRRVYAARGVHDAQALRYELPELAGPQGLLGLDAAVERLAAAVTAGEAILVIGDFDADGAASCATAVLALRAMGAGRVDYLVPDRFEYGYGLTPEIVTEAAARAPDLLVTVDNGVSSVEGVAAARARGLDVVVTDHHLPPGTLPAPLAMVNPNLPGDTFPSKHLAGVGVIFYVLAGLRHHLRERGWFRAMPEPRMADYLDLVALGTVADLVPLDRNNRVLVEQGLRRIRAGRGRPGIAALLEIAGREPGQCVATDLAFAAAPRLNAAGRLEDMVEGIECLLTHEPARARARAERLDALNRERRDIQERMQADALADVEALSGALEGGTIPPALCVTDDDWHQGVVGIVASRLRERFHRPAIAFAPVGNGELKGSGRSVPGFHIRDALERTAARHPGLVTRFGGHAAAAGLTLAAAALPRFREAFTAVAGEQLDADALTGVCLTDGPLADDELSLGTARAIRAGGPWGQGFPEPRFDGLFRVREARVVGGNHLRMRLQQAEGGRAVEAIAFRAVDAGWDPPPERIRIAYRLDINRWRGEERLQLVVEHLEPADAEV